MSARARPIAVTGSRGRLGRAVLTAFGSDDVRSWDRPTFDLDRPSSFEHLFDQDGPGVVVHAAAMTDVDACARDPELALRRNGDAVGELAMTCRARGVGLVVVSTNEVFDGTRTDGQGYEETDEPRPGNPYGESKLAGERAALSGYGGGPGLWIVRTAWLFGPPGNDFPDKVTSAADALAPGERLRVVADEVGSPTYAVDLAQAIRAMLERTDGGLFHVVNAGRASRFDWAARVLGRRRPGRMLEPIKASEYVRASSPPRWGVLDTRRLASLGIDLRDWQVALDEHLTGLGR